MKKQALTLIGLLSLLLAAGSAFAQTNGQAVRANIPFNFVVNKHALPPGEYTITPIGANGDVLVIRGDDTKEGALVIAARSESMKAADKTKLVFRCYGDRYFLSQMWIEGSVTGRQLPKSAHESEVAMDFSAKDVVVMAALR
jgi:hypothetical protein